jgi:hypothetical protein
MKSIQQPNLPTKYISKNTMPLFDKEYDEEEKILLCGLPYLLFGPRKKDIPHDGKSNIQRHLIKKNFIKTF